MWTGTSKSAKALWKRSKMEGKTNRMAETYGWMILLIFLGQIITHVFKNIRMVLLLPFLKREFAKRGLKLEAWRSSMLLIIFLFWGRRYGNYRKEKGCAEVAFVVSNGGYEGPFLQVVVAICDDLHVEKLLNFQRSKQIV